MYELARSRVNGLNPLTREPANPQRKVSEMKKMNVKKSNEWLVASEKSSGEWRVARFFVMTVVFFLSSAFCSLFSETAYANNLVIENIALTDKDADTNTYDIKFDIAWDNSWFIGGAPSASANWDAAWVFAKFSKSSDSGVTWSDWAHCTFLNTGNSAPASSQMSFGATASAYVGAFMYRASAGTGSVDWNNAEIRWAYGTDLVADTDIVKIKVFGIEMVYIPQGSFYVGDGTVTTIQGQLEAGTTGAAFQITGEGALTLGGGAAGSIGNNNAAGMVTADDFNDATSQTLPAAFQKGYNAFYMMKYEVSQGQYCNFLNTLTATQAGNRWATGTFNSYRYFIKKADNGKFGCDANNNAGTDGSANWFLLNEAADGQWVACNYLSWADLCAYADWAGLRPFTELEYEKACKGGGQAAVADAYACGNTTLESATSSLTNAGTISETPNQGNLNYSSCLPDGPFRVGSYADSSSTRTNAGAGYYGGLDLSGSLGERPVTIGNTTGRAFTGNHGNGVLASNGNADAANWPGTGATGAGTRGGSWYDVTTSARVSDRSGAAYVSSSRNRNYGARAARTP